MKAADFRDKSDQALGDELVALRREQFNLRMQSATGESSKNHEHGRVRKDIARVKTILSERRGSSGDNK